jgi:hypothetical protein
VNAKYVQIDGGEPIPVIESVQLQDDFQTISASTFLDRSGRKILWPALDYQTRATFGGHMPLLESVFAYQASSASPLTTRFVSKTYTSGADIMSVVLESGQTTLTVTDGDGNALEYMEELKFEEHSKCFRHVVIAEANTYNYNVPVAVHEKSYNPHARFKDDVLTIKTFSDIKHGGLVDEGKDVRSGVLLASAMTPATVSNW